MKPTSFNHRDPTIQANHIYQIITRRVRAITQLPECVRSPTLDTTARSQRTSVVTPSGNGNYPASQPINIRWAALQSSPTLDTAARSQRASMVFTGGDGRHPVGQANHIQGN